MTFWLPQAQCEIMFYDAWASQNPGHFFDFEELNQIALGNVVIAFDVQAALKALFDLPRIVLEAFEAFQLASEDDHVVAQQAQACAAPHQTSGDHATGDVADLGDAEDLANLRVAEENQIAARSRIMDADIAAETAALARAQVLQESGIALLVQANAIPMNVVNLLRNSYL